MDIEDPTAPMIVGAVANGDYMRYLAVRGSMAYCCGEIDGFQIIDASDPNSPALLGRIALAWPAAEVSLQGDRAYIVKPEVGVHAIDITDPMVPMVVGLASPPSGSGYNLVPMGRFGAVSMSGGGIRTVDLTDCDDCPVDLTWDGWVDTRDCIAFCGLWAAGDPRADWDGDGGVTTQDFTAYLDAWLAGC